MRPFQRSDRGRQTVIVHVLTRFERIGVDFRQIVNVWRGKIQASLLHKGAAIVDVPRKALLTQIRVQTGHRFAQPRQCRCHMH